MVIADERYPLQSTLFISCYWIQWWGGKTDSTQVQNLLKNLQISLTKARAVRKNEHQGKGINKLLSYYSSRTNKAVFEKKKEKNKAIPSKVSWSPVLALNLSSKCVCGELRVSMIEPCSLSDPRTTHNLSKLSDSCFHRSLSSRRVVSLLFWARLVASLLTIPAVWISVLAVSTQRWAVPCLDFKDIWCWNITCCVAYFLS